MPGYLPNPEEGLTPGSFIPTGLGKEIGVVVLGANTTPESADALSDLIDRRYQGGSIDADEHSAAKEMVEQIILELIKPENLGKSLEEVAAIGNLRGSYGIGEFVMLFAPSDEYTEPVLTLGIRADMAVRAQRDAALSSFQPVTRDVILSIPIPDPEDLKYGTLIADITGMELDGEISKPVADYARDFVAVMEEDPDEDIAAHTFVDGAGQGYLSIVFPEENIGPENG